MDVCKGGSSSPLTNQKQYLFRLFRENSIFLCFFGKKYVFAPPGKLSHASQLDIKVFLQEWLHSVRHCGFCLSEQRLMISSRPFSSTTIVVKTIVVVRTFYYASSKTTTTTTNYPFVKTRHNMFQFFIDVLAFCIAILQRKTFFDSRHGL